MSFSQQSVETLQKMTTTELCRLVAKKRSDQLTKEHLLFIYNKLHKIRNSYLLTSFFSRPHVYSKLFEYRVVDKHSFNDFIEFLSQARRLLYFVVYSSDALKYAYEQNIVTDKQLINLFENELFYEELIKFSKTYDSLLPKFYRNTFLCSAYLSQKDERSIKYFVHLLEISKSFEKFLKSDKRLTYYLTDLLSKSQKNYLYLKVWLNQRAIKIFSDRQFELGSSNMFEDFLNCIVFNKSLIAKIIEKDLQLVCSQIRMTLDEFKIRKLISSECYKLLYSKIS